MKYNSLQLTLREMQAQIFSTKTLLALITIGLLLGLVGPFQTFAQ